MPRRGIRIRGIAELGYAVGVERAEGAVVVLWIGGRQDGLVSGGFFGYVVFLVGGDNNL